MFYAHFVLAKKGPLARIWLAAHWDKKLTKTHVFETNIESSVEGILQPKVKMALRTSGHLLLGIVRIYSRKAKYLLADCNEAFIKIKLAFRPGVVDLPEDNREAAVATITLPEVFHDFDTAMPDLNIDIDAQVTLNQSRAEDITLKEDYGTLSLMVDDGFEDMTFTEPEAARDVTNMEEGFEHASLLLGDDQAKDRPEETAQSTSNNTTVNKTNVSFDAPLKDDGFGGTLGQGLLEDGDTAGLFEPAGLFDDAPVGHVALENTTQNAEQTEMPVEPTVEKPPEPQPEEESDDDMYDMAPGSIGAPSPPSSPETPMQPSTTDNVPEADVGNLLPANATDAVDMPPPSTPLTAPPSDPATEVLTPLPPEPPTPLPEIPATPAVPTLDHTTLINNEDESFALAPLDTTIVHGPERTVKAKRKRKLIVDEVKNISGEEMKAQLSDTTDIVITLDLAPPTKRLMHWKETGGVEKLFALPGHPILSKTLSRDYQRHLTTRSVDNEEFGVEDDHINLDAEMEQAREDPEATVLASRKRPRREVIPQDLSHLDTLHLDTSHPSYAGDHNMTHPSLDVPNFLQPPPMFPPPIPQPPQQMMNNVQPPPDHMFQQMLQNDVNQLAHLPEIMHPSMVDQGPPLHAITPTITNDPPPSVSDAFNQLVQSGIESVTNHPLSNALPDHMHQSPIENQIPTHSPLKNQMNHQQSIQDQLSVADHISNMENHLHPGSSNNMIQHGHMDGTLIQPPVDEEATQPCTAEEYSRALVENTNPLPSTIPNAVPNSDHHNILPVVNGPSNEGNIENCTVQNEGNQPVNQQSASNILFDSLKNGENFNQNISQTETQNNPPTDEANDDNAEQKKNELPVSDDEDDYAAPASVGPALPEEQMADETYEQFEERILTKRTTHMLHIINNKLDRDNKVNFADVVKNNKRKQVAQKFYTFLVLKKLQAVELEQEESYGVLIITRGPKYDAVYNGN